MFEYFFSSKTLRKCQYFTKASRRQQKYTCSTKKSLNIRHHCVLQKKPKNFVNSHIMMGGNVRQKKKKFGDLILVRSTLAKLHFNVSQDSRVREFSLVVYFCKNGAHGPHQLLLLESGSS